MSEVPEVRKSRKTNVFLSDDEWTRWRVWLAQNNHSGSLVLSEYIRKLIRTSVQIPAKVVSSSKPAAATRRPKPKA
jgi:hypothetical protein